MMLRIILPSLFLLYPVLCAADADDAIQPAPMQLSLKHAVELAISPDGNANIQLENEEVRQSKGRSQDARAPLMPNVQSYASQTSNIRSLAALGAQSVKLPFNFHLPSAAGPYDITDVRLTATQTVFDFSALRRWQSARKAVGATKSDREHATDEVTALVAKAYVTAVRADADLEAANSDVVLAKALLAQAENEKKSGTGTGIEVTRQRVKLADQTQHLLEAQTEKHTAHLQLARIIGIRQDTELELTDRLEYSAMDPMTIEQAKTEAFKNRQDFIAQQEHQDSARLASSAANWSRLPTIQAWGDYGTIGQTDVAIMPTRDFGVILRFPIFDGGHLDAERGIESSRYREEKIKTNDLRQQIELDVRTALDNLHSAGEEVRVAQEGLELADSELTQARRRYEAGVTNGLEVTDSETQLEHARDNQISAIYNYNIARVSLGEAMGTIRKQIQ
jgi:outer membrane protein